MRGGWVAIVIGVVDRVVIFVVVIAGGDSVIGDASSA